MASDNDSSKSRKKVAAFPRRRFLALLGVSGAGGLAGCSGSGGGSDGTTTSTDTPKGGGDDNGGGMTTTTTSSDTETSTNGNFEPGPSFNFALGSAPSTLDVHKTSRVPENIVLDAITDRLFHLDENKNPVPQLVSSYERSDDATQYIFQLEEGHTYHNGDPFNAESAAWNLNRFLDVGPQSVVLGKPETIEATGDYELTMEYSKAKPRLPIQLANWFTGFAPKSVIEDAGENYGQSVVSGLGPFKFEKWTKGSNIKVSVNPDYDFGPEFASNRGPAHLGEINFNIIPEPTTRISELTNGNVHGTPYVSLSDASSVVDSPNTSFHENPFPYPAFFPLNMQREPTSDIRVRKAIAHAIRRKPIVKAALSGHGTPIWGLAPPNSVNGMPKKRAKKVGYTYDPDRARSLLDKAGWTNDKQGEIRTKNGKKLHIVQLGFALKQWSTQAKVAQQMLKEVGIDVEVLVVEGGTFYSKLENQEYHTLTGGTSALFAADFLKHTLSSEVLATKGGYNTTMYESDKMDSLIDTALTAPSEKERSQAVAKAQEKALKEVAWVPIMVVNRTYGHKKKVKNVNKFMQHDWWPNQYYLHHLEVNR